jgi:predicted dienelactone hydrolase
MQRTWKVVRKTLAIGAAVGVLAVGLLFASLALEHQSPLELPRPTGPFAVGRLATTWVDTARMDPFAPTPPRHRELVVWIWYPAESSDRARTAEYLPAPWRRALAEHSGVLLTRFFYRDLTKVHGHSLENAAVARARPTYPVVVFRSGIGALALQYSTLVEDLASHGYIVVGADAPYSTSVVVMPDGRVIHKTLAGNPGDAPIPEAERVRLAQALIGVWTADTRFLLDRLARLDSGDPAGLLAGRIDLGWVGIAGHSFGGATAAQLCHDDRRCRAGVDLDGRLFGSVVKEGMDQPFLFLMSDHGNAFTSSDCQICDQIRSAARRNPTDKLIVTMLRAHHFSCADFAVLQSRILRSALVALGGQGGLDPRTGLAAHARYVRELFDVHLRGTPRAALYSGPLVPGARFETK